MYRYRGLVLQDTRRISLLTLTATFIASKNITFFSKIKRRRKEKKTLFTCVYVFTRTFQITSDQRSKPSTFTDRKRSIFHGASHHDHLTTISVLCFFFVIFCPRITDLRFYSKVLKKGKEELWVR